MTSTQDLYRIDEIPIFGNWIYDSEACARACPRGDIRLVENQETGLVYNETFRPELMNYSEKYDNEQGISPAFRQHLQDVAQIIERNIGRSRITEVGCGKGQFLEMLLAQGFDVTGFDPAYTGSNDRIARRP